MTRDKGFTLIELLIVVAIIGIITAIAIPYLLNAIERAKQTMTVERISALGKYIEQYIMDHNNVGCPKVGGDVNALIPIFKAEEINFNDTAVTDGWGYDLILESEAAMGGRLYTIISYGSDGVPGPPPVTPGIVKRFTEDIVWRLGTFQQRPEGAQMSK